MTAGIQHQNPKKTKTFDFLFRVFSSSYFTQKQRHLFSLVKQSPLTDCYLADYKVKNSIPENGQLFLTLPLTDGDSMKLVDELRTNDYYVDDYVLNEQQVCVIFKYNSDKRLKTFLSGKYSEIYSKGEPTAQGRYPHYELHHTHHLESHCFGYGYNKLLDCWHILTKSPAYFDYMIDTFYNGDTTEKIKEIIYNNEWASPLVFENETLNYQK